MRALSISLFALVSLSSAAQAFEGQYQKYYCTDGNPFTSGISAKNSFEVIGDTNKSKDLIDGVLGGKGFRFEVQEKQKKDISTWSSKAAGVTVSIQRPGPYDGFQDSIWGEIKSGRTKHSLNCFLGDR